MPKTKKKKDQPQGTTVPTEWVGKSAEQLKVLVDQLEHDLDNARKSRNKVMTEFASVQSYYDVTREDIRELDMRIEKQDLEVENMEEDNDDEMKVYEQKSTYIKYCHDQKMTQTKEDTASRTNDSYNAHTDQVNDAHASKARLEDEKIEIERRLVDEYSNMRINKGEELSSVKEQLNADVRAFEKQCEAHLVLLKNELDARRTSELHAIETRKQSHLKDIMISHERACSDMRSYFDGVEKQQSIDIEELQAQIRRLKKIAEKNESDSSDLRESNRIHGDDLQMNSVKVIDLKTQTKDKEKDKISLQAANARLSATRRAIRESREEHKKLQLNVDAIKGDIEEVMKKGSGGKLQGVLSSNVAKREALEDSLASQMKKNDIINLHLQHTLASAGLSKDESAEITANISEFVTQKNKEIDRLTMMIAQETEEYNNHRSMLIKRGVSVEDIVS